MDFYTNVTKRQYSNGKGLPNFGTYDAQARMNKAEKAKAEKAKAEAAMEAARMKVRAKHEDMAKHYTLEAYKTTVITDIS